MALSRSAAPTDLPVSLAEAKAHLRVEASYTTDDADIASCLAAVVDMLDGPEGLLNRALITQTLTLTMDCFPGTVYDERGFQVFSSLATPSAFDLPLPPMRSVTSIAYLDTNGDSQTLAASGYRVLNANNPTRRGRVELAYGSTWPSTRPIEQAVTVTYSAGFGDATAVPDHYKRLIMVLAKELYDHRTPLVPENLTRSPALSGLLAQCTFPAYS